MRLLEEDPFLPATFEALGLRPEIVRRLTALGLSKPTRVQELAIPVVMAGKDAIVQAQTGSGKTYAFGLPILSDLEAGFHPAVLVVVPTRELAGQVHDALEAATPGRKLHTVAIYGGVSIERQEKALAAGCDIVVGTPGRLKDLLGRRTLNLTEVSTLVLDEADVMLDMGFRRDIEFLIDRLPGREQTLIFSATMPEAIKVIAQRYLKSPVIVGTPQDAAPPREIRHSFLRVDREQRVETLIALLALEAPERALIFTAMKHETKRLAAKLERHAGIRAGFLNGNMSQSARNTMLARFKAGELTTLVATDVAARGLDIEGLSHVIHYSVPTVVETYIHRSGRTGRAGNSGKAILMVPPEAEADFKAIRKTMAFQEIHIERDSLPVLDVPAEPERGGKPAPARTSTRGADRGPRGTWDRAHPSQPERGRKASGDGQIATGLTRRRNNRPR